LKNRLRVLRAEYRMSQAELAERLGVARQTVHAIENDKFAPSLVLAFKIASLFGTDINDVFAPGEGETLPSLLESSPDDPAHHHLEDRPARTRPLVFFGKPRADGGR
jgi:putative transcriptional regulator